MCLACGNCSLEHSYNTDDAIDAAIEWLIKPHFVASRDATLDWVNEMKAL